MPWNATWDVILDTIEAIALVIVATILSLTFLMLRREFLRASQTLRTVVEGQQMLLAEQQHQIEELARVWIRTEENSRDIRALKAEIDELKRSR